MNMNLIEALDAMDEILSQQPISEYDRMMGISVTIRGACAVAVVASAEIQPEPEPVV